MCGIVGFNWDDKGLAKRLLDKFSYRGPDESIMFSDRGITLGMNRLGYPGMKKNIYPVTNENKDIFLVIDGSIFNSRELKGWVEESGHVLSGKSDDEVIVHLYEDYGDTFVEHLRGEFALCLYDLRARKLIIARDRAGVKPIYYYVSSSSFVFASEIKAIIEPNTVKRELNIEAMNSFFVYGFNPLEETMFKGVRRVLPGQMLVYNVVQKSIQKISYWSASNIKEAEEKLDFYEHKTMAFLKGAIGEQIDNDIVPGVFLSGGVDSAAMLFILSQFRAKDQGTLGKPIKTYTALSSGKEVCDEGGYARELSKLFNTEHREIMIGPESLKLIPRIAWHMDEPSSDPALIPSFFLSKLAKDNSQIVFAGHGCDELFSGYDQYRAFHLAAKARRLPFSEHLAKFSMGSMRNDMLDKLHWPSKTDDTSAKERGLALIETAQEDKAKAYSDLVGIFKDKERQAILSKENFLKENYASKNEQFFSDKREDFAKQAMILDMSTFLAENQLMSSDRMAAANGIKTRMPFLDSRFVELALKMPLRYKIHGSETKYVFRRSVKELLPEKFLTRKRHSMHAPITSWIGDEMKTLSSDLLNITKIARRGIIDPYEVKKIIANFNDGKLQYANQLWTILSFEIWHRIFIDKENIEF